MDTSIGNKRWIENQLCAYGMIDTFNGEMAA